MEQLIFIFSGIIIGALIAYFWSKATNASTKARLSSDIESKDKEIAMLNRIIADNKEDAKQQLQEEKAAHIAQQERQLADLRRSYEDQLALFKSQISNITAEFLKLRSGELQDANDKKMEQLFRPIKEDIEKMERSISEHRVQNARTTEGFEHSIRLMLESNDRISKEASRLSTALQKQNKVVGNWGELILSELLESQGLKEGTHYDVQRVMKDESGESITNEDTGTRMIPDVILHLADNRDVVVDSKMSLSAFIDYQNAEDIEQQNEALKRHIASVRSHVAELAAKNYSSYIKKPRKSIDFVIMFVPIEGALQLALSADPRLWREAFDKKVYIAGGQTLLAALRIIDLTWVSILQDRNTERIMDEARKLIDRVEKFYDEFQAVGRHIKDAAKAYGDVSKRVNDGQQSILSTGRRLENLGARGKKALPSE